MGRKGNAPRGPMGDPRGYLEHDEVMAIIAHTPSPRTRTILRMLFATGARISEVLALQMGDIDWKNRTVSLVTLKQRVRRLRVIPVDAVTISALRTYVRRMDLWNPTENGRHGPYPKNALFCVGYQAVRKAIMASAARAGVQLRDGKRMHLHALRHSHAIQALKAGVNVRMLQEVLGHSSLATTTQYLKVTADDVRKEYQEKVWKE